MRDSGSLREVATDEPGCRMAKLAALSGVGMLSCSWPHTTCSIEMLVYVIVAWSAGAAAVDAIEVEAGMAHMRLPAAGWFHQHWTISDMSDNQLACTGSASKPGLRHCNAQHAAACKSGCSCKLAPSACGRD